MGLVKDAEDIKVFLFQKYPFLLEVLTHDSLLLPNWLRFSINFLEDDFDEIHLALSESFHFLKLFRNINFAGCSFESLNNSFVVLELFLL